MRVCMCLRARLINAVSIRRREWEGERGRRTNALAHALAHAHTGATVTDIDRAEGE